MQETSADDMEVDVSPLENHLTVAHPSDLKGSVDALEDERYMKWVEEEIHFQMSLKCTIEDYIEMEDDYFEQWVADLLDDMSDSDGADPQPLPKVPCPICNVHGLRCENGNVYCPKDMYVIQMEHPQTDLENVREILCRVLQVSSILCHCIFSQTCVGVLSGAHFLLLPWRSRFLSDEDAGWESISLFLWSNLQLSSSEIYLILSYTTRL